MNSREVCNYLKIHPSTLWRWEKLGKLVPERTKTNRKYYTKEQINQYLILETHETHSKAK